MERYRKTKAEAAVFQVVGGTARSQGAFMTLAPGEATGGPDNRHPTSDQWLFVASGAGSAIVDGEQVALEAGDLLLIAAGEGHEVRAADGEPLVTVSVYAPPVY